MIFHVLDFKKASKESAYEELCRIMRGGSEKQNLMPKHENVIKNFVNVELFHKKDSKNEDCIGWITIMEKGGKDLRKILKEEKIGIEERKRIAEGIKNGYRYLKDIGIRHFDLKMENILMVDGIPKIIDFGLVRDETGRSGYGEMGYTRRGSKFRESSALCKFILKNKISFFSCCNARVCSSRSIFIWNLWCFKSFLFFILRLENRMDSSLQAD